MCRMVALRFLGRARSLAGELIDAAVEASANDPYLERLVGDSRHCHGYGFALARRVKGSWEVMRARFDAAPRLTGDEACEANLKALEEAADELKALLRRGEEFALILHGRRTGSEPRGVNAGHPFSGEVVLQGHEGPELFEVLLSHNGGVRKSDLAALIGLRDPSVYTDSHVLLKFVLSRLEGRPVGELVGGLRDAVREAAPYALGSLNALAMFVGQSSGPFLFAVGYVTAREESRRAYFEPVLVKADGLSGFVSSTARDVAARRGVRAEFSSRAENFVAMLDPSEVRTVEV
ncbi:MAG: hypothetical protein ABDH63_04130 [Candidatus Caldarchaeales archaeon]